jgi:hypothetical protein
MTVPRKMKNLSEVWGSSVAIGMLKIFVKLYFILLNPMLLAIRVF